MFGYRLFQKIKLFPYRYELILCIILIFSGFFVYLPHFSYPFPFHVDEWYHIAMAKMISAGSSINWYYGESFQYSLEVGWHYSLSLVDRVFNPDIFSWMYFPIIIQSFAIISVYILVSKLFSKKEAIISSLLVAILPTNVTIGGPIFLIPVNLSLIFIPMAMVFTFQLSKIKQRYQYLFLYIIITFILYAHPPTAMVLLFFLGFFLLLIFIMNDKDQKKHGLFILIITIFSCISALPNYIIEIQTSGISSISFNFWVFLNEIPYIIGFLQTLFFVLGFYYLTKFKSKKIWSILLTTIFLLINIVLFANLGINYFLPYQRTYVPLFLFMILIAAYGYTRIPEFNPKYKHVLTIILLCLLVGTIVEGISRTSTYYEIIDETDYENFLWIKNFSSKEDIVLCDPWKARAFAPIAERTVYAVVPFGPTEKYINLTQNANEFLENNCRNTTFLLDNNISIIYTRGYQCHNPDLKQVKDDIYVINNNFR